jgi:hypothetical protein
MTPLDWREHDGIPNIQAPLSVAGDYVISHRPEQFTLSYRPTGHHVPLGQFTTEQEAKDKAQRHANFEIVNCLGETRTPQPVYPDGSYSCPFCLAGVAGTSPAALARKCPNPACFARHDPPFPADVAREIVDKIEARKREERARKELHEERMRLAAESAQAKQVARQAVTDDARVRGACATCAVDSIRYGGTPKFTKHRNGCPKEKRR